MAAGALFILGSVQIELKSALFWVGLLIIGVGFGLMASQLGNVNMSAVEQEDSAEVGGLQGTFQNLGSSFGTALVGSIFMMTLTSGFIGAVQSSPDLSQNSKDSITAKAENGVQVVSPSQAEQYVLSQGGSQDTAKQVSSIYQTSQIKALKIGMFFVFAAAILSLALSRNLPKEKPS
jgi:hypothetical protein